MKPWTNMGRKVNFDMSKKFNDLLKCRPTKNIGVPYFEFSIRELRMIDGYEPRPSLLCPMGNKYWVDFDD